jgi:hypothetical protein
LACLHKGIHQFPPVLRLITVLNCGIHAKTTNPRTRGVFRDEVWERIKESKVVKLISSGSVHHEVIDIDWKQTGPGAELNRAFPDCCVQKMCEGSSVYVLYAKD